MEKKRYTQEDGQRLYEEDRVRTLADPELKALYETEAHKKELWLQLVEARQEAGLTQKEVARRIGVSQAQVARIEKRGYEGYTLRTLQRYIDALGNQFKLAITIQKIDGSHTAQINT